MDVFHADFLKVAVKKPGSSYGVFDMLALPLGATGSVSGFLRISAAVHFIGLHMGVLWTSFFDDFTAICPCEDQESVTYAVHYYSSYWVLISPQNAGRPLTSAGCATRLVCNLM